MDYRPTCIFWTMYLIDVRLQGRTSILSVYSKELSRTEIYFGQIVIYPLRPTSIRPRSMADQTKCDTFYKCDILLLCSFIKHSQITCSSPRKNEMNGVSGHFLCIYRLNWARRTSWGWSDEWDDTALQTHDSKFEHATSRSRRLHTILNNCSSTRKRWGIAHFPEH